MFLTAQTAHTVRAVPAIQTARTAQFAQTRLAAMDHHDHDSTAALSDQEFRLFQRMMFEVAGISIAASKKQLVSGRLAKRIKHYGFGNYGDYFRLIEGPGGSSERQTAIDLLTTNETYFFREPKHFSLLRDTILPALDRQQPVRVWSAACSSGEEPYSLAMTLADSRGDLSWEVMASDICTRVLEKARVGHYPMERMQDIPPSMLSRYCLKGVGTEEGTFLVGRALRERVRFLQLNLNAALPSLGQFDVIFLRNVMIYFDMPTKRQVVQRILPHLKRGGYFVVSHSESLHGVTDALVMTTPSVYRKP
jgi:chemotaxis protein methyltransferase CheR